MKVNLPLLLFAAALVPAPSGARTFVVGPDPCPAPADILVYRIPAEVEAQNQNGWSLAGDGAIVIYDAPLIDAPKRGWARRRLFARFVLDPEGLARAEPPRAATAPGCAHSGEGR
jgi:hypothetical protein